MKFISFIWLCLIIWLSSIYIIFIWKTPKYPVATTIHDQDNDDINDIDDIILWARKEVDQKTLYQDGYFQWGYPPKWQWVCSDVVWRAFESAWFNIKQLIDTDIAKYTSDYPRVAWKPEPNIDFRRVPNLNVFFKKYSTSLTTKIIPNNYENLSQWQAGDIIIFDQPNQHIAIISDRRDKNGVPYMLHNYHDYAREDNWVFYDDPKKFPIIGHYRIKYGSFSK